VHKCWEGHRLRRAAQDGRIHRACVWCEQKASAGAPILVCSQCRWTVCTACQARPRLPRLEDDPFFFGPNAPRLFPPPQQAVSASRGTVIICPGGNYEFLVPGEGMPVAELLASRGIRALVLRYRLLPAHGLKDMLQDLSSAVALVRRTYGGPVAAMGFSAGGHLVASLALRTRKLAAPAGKRNTKKAAIGVAEGRCRPLDAQVLVYPCIDASDWANPDDCGFFDWDKCFPVSRACMLQGREALLGGTGFAAPPTFLVASTADEASPPKEHTDPYAVALKRQGVPCKYLRRNYGAHGFGLHGGWFDRAADWLREQGFGC